MPSAVKIQTNFPWDQSELKIGDPLMPFSRNAGNIFWAQTNSREIPYFLLLESLPYNNVMVPDLAIAFTKLWDFWDFFRVGTPIKAWAVWPGFEQINKDPLLKVT